MFFQKKEKFNTDSLKSAFLLQKKTLIEKNYPELLNMSQVNFNNALDILWKSVEQKTKNLEVKIKGNIPLLIVVEKSNWDEKN